MQPRDDTHSFSLRTLLASSSTPFVVAHYEPGAIICFQGDACAGVMYIESGQVRLAVTARSGQEGITGLLGAGAFLGEEGIVDDRGVQGHTVIAMTPTAVLVVPRVQMIRLLHTESSVLDRFVAHALARQARLEADLMDQLLNSCEQRLARALLLLAGCDTRHSTPGVLPRVSQEILAEMVGTTRSRINGFMGKFKKLGFIEADGGLIHVRPCRLRLVRRGDRGVSTRTAVATSQPIRSEKRAAMSTATL